MRKLLSILVALSLCASFASLSLAEEETREVIFWHAMGGVNGEMITQLTDEYNETLGKEQGIHVTAIFQGLYADMRTKFMGAIQAQDMANLPDIVQMGASALGMMQEVQEVVWFEDILAMDTTMKLEDFEPKFVRSFSAEGRALGVPFASSTVILYYNEDMLREAGIEAPPATLAEMGEAAAKLYKEENGEPVQWGFVCQPGSWFMSSWIGMQASSEGNYSYIGNTADGREGVMTQVVFDEEGTMKRFLENYKAACEAGHFKVTSTNDLEEFAAGKVAMYIGSTSAFASVLQTVGDKFSFGCAFMPTVTAEDVGGVAAGPAAPLFVCLPRFDVGSNLSQLLTIPDYILFGIIGIIVEDIEASTALNAILHQYSDIIVGRLGIPYRDRGVSIISLAVDGSREAISAMTEKLGQLNKVSVNSVITGM